MNKQNLYNTVEEKSQLIKDLSDKIWDYAEISMEEFKSADAFVQVMKSEGFEVETNLCGIKTAFLGRYGSGKPVIGILGEFDALSGLSQVAGATQKQWLCEGGNGHGCGHNLLGAASLGAAIAVKREIEKGNLSGTVVFYGCPGEEGCAGKAFMARDGMFRDLDAALCWHPGDVNEVTTGSNAASLQIEYSFTGLTAHAAGDPQNGRSALDAAELMNVGVQFLREHMPSKCSLHYSFIDAGGVSPNVVQSTAKTVYMVRGENVTEAKKLLERVHKVAQGAALMTETEVHWRQIDGTASTLSNHVLEQALYSNLCEAPLPKFTAEEQDFAAQIKSTFTASELPGGRTPLDWTLKQFVAEKTDNGTLPLNNFVLPYAPSDCYSQGSTDVGDVSWITPTAQFTATTWASGNPGHSWQNVAMGKSTVAHKGVLYAAKVLAGTAADLMTDADILGKAKAEFAVTAAAGYDCPIGTEVKAPHTEE